MPASRSAPPIPRKLRKPTGHAWLLLIHQIPPKPAYLRVKVWRRLQRLGAVAIKNSVYALPAGDQTLEDFQWVAREIAVDKGDAVVCEAGFVEGLSDAQVVSLFHQARNADYEQVAGEARRLFDRPPAARAAAETELARLRRRLAEVVAIDHLAAPGRAAAERRIAALEQRVKTGPPAPAPPGPTLSPAKPSAYKGRTWVTREDIHIDRIASAWLIRRFIDPAARIKFVPASGYQPRPREVRFDMFDAEFTHLGERCTFEVLAGTFASGDPALRPLAEIVHDIDLKDSRFLREEAAGVGRLIDGVIASCKDDQRRLERGAALFDDLYASFGRKKP